ncbi:ABC-type Fe3+/spermidine/putrescine transport system ATPase subunit [Silvibacterium bohemicum]|uniref:ABC-type Fe3+/spermidine/putrescine transport system ATPase subunit n=1 Tax=Silvibacterium bohemicum TaxID=1577686 RepID=A0A841JWH1_9BACT|nr:ABC transporter ATP-binding protein [Silvibacterium bohemicum]MBB6144797.1 ABC-type Fe3+/spermidine/putrescine transport system ATPase subunit [Silvibacterium bohemicum]
MSTQPAAVAPGADSGNTGPALLRIENVSKSFGANKVLESISLDIERGEFLTLLGESGSGKTTLLRLIAGFEEATEGRILLEGERIDNQPAYRRPVHTVFQSYALFPHMSVFDNAAYGLSVRGHGRDEIKTKVEMALGKVRMETFASRYPREISGGQKQRVALARALVNSPKVLLLDEPLSALDANLRVEMQHELKQLQRELGIAFIFVTHDQSEALAISDRIVLLHRGRIEQSGAPREIYARPRTVYAANFLGKSNLIRGFVTDGVANCSIFSFPLPVEDGPIALSLRPEVMMSGVIPSEPGVVRFEAEVVDEQFHGAASLLRLRCSPDCELMARVDGEAPRERVRTFAFRIADCVLLEQDEPRPQRTERP